MGDTVSRGLLILGNPLLRSYRAQSQLARCWKEHNVQGDAKGYKYQNNLNSKNVNGESN